MTVQSTNQLNSSIKHIKVFHEPNN